VIIDRKDYEYLENSCRSHLKKAQERKLLLLPMITLACDYIGFRIMKEE